MVGAQPSMEIVAKENVVTIMDHEEGKKVEEFVEDPMGVPRRIMEDWSPQIIDELPDAFCGKLVRNLFFYCISWCSWHLGFMAQF